jgi:demethylmenaquinone methyltransferase/2-methoxy-6-polyprenyl-1,4-benzoquinol methylase
VHELVERYDRIAAKWSRLTGRLGYPQAYERLLAEFIREAELTASSKPLRVLDCGVGTGTFALAFAHEWATPVCMNAVDVSDVMISNARQRLHQAGLEVAFQRADVCALPYSDNQFDLVMAAHVLEHLPDPVVALKEMLRILKPGGWLVACLTRNSILGRYVHLKWHTHQLTSKTAESWLNAAGLDVCRMNLGATGCFRHTSLTCIGRKPNQP